jgi:hypothetical protein
MSSPEPAQRLPRWLPSPLAIFALVLSGLLFGVVLAKGPWDSDYFWHVTTGEIIATSGLPSTDPYSFTWGGRPWILHEWLSEVLLFRLVDSLGYLGAVVVFAILPGVTFAILAYSLAALRLRTAAIAIAVTLSALVLVPYMTLRPQVLSWLFFAVLVSALLHLRPAHGRWTLLALPFFALWANVHGLWAVALGVLLLYVLLTFIGQTPMAPARRWAGAGFVAAVAGTAFTPSGFSGLLYPLRYIEGGDWGLANITEWQSPNFHEPAHFPLLALMVAVALVGRHRVPLWLSLLSYAGIVLALLALRNAPVAAILSVPAIAIGLSNTLDEWRPAQVTRSRRIAVARRWIEIVAGAVVLVAGLVLLVPADPTGAVADNIERNHPVQGVDLLLDVHPDARVVAEYGWGGYVIGRMYPTGGRVMVDGRNDMYNQAILEEYSLIRQAEPGWIDVVERYDPDALLFPPEMAITKGPAEAAGWCEAYRDENEVLFLRSCP